VLSFFGLVPAVRDLPLAHEFLAPYVRGETFRTVFLTQRTAGTVSAPDTTSSSNQNSLGGLLPNGRQCLVRRSSSVTACQ
jgi:hypothetical protein